MEVVKLVENGEIKTGILLNTIDLPKEYSHLAYSCGAKTNFFAGVTIEFLAGGGFPVKHSGFLYVSNGNIESDPEMVRRWPKHTRINERWFTISD